MPQFAPSVAKTAIAPIVAKPSGMNCEAEIFLGPDELTKVATSGRIPFVSTGVAKNVSLPITMPAALGTYHGYIDVFTEGLRFLAYVLKEDVQIASLAFNFSNVSARLVELSSAPAWNTIIFNCRVTNPNNVSLTKQLQLIRKQTDRYGVVIGPSPWWAFNLTLAPGQSYDFVWDGNTVGQRDPEAINGPLVGAGVTMCMSLKDVSAGISSAEACVSG